ncbi:hypothetical protein [Streptomyces sp. NPDC048845]|uniref:hypothetical protein n=1 Tax=Streptomyces sp. NPDC048845 TaxID=3155390 RepID=UPI00341B205F
MPSTSASSAWRRLSSRLGQLTRRPLKLPGCRCPHEQFCKISALKGVQQPRPALPTGECFEVTGLQIVGGRLQQGGHGAGPSLSESDR